MSVSQIRDSISILACIESYLPGVRGGGPVRALANLVEQVGDSHHFDILTRNHDYLVSQAYPEIEPNVWLNRPNANICFATEDQWCQQLLNRVEAFPPQWLYLNGALAPMTRRILQLRCRNKRLHSIPILLAPHGNFGSGSLRRHFLRKRAWLCYAKARRLYQGVYWHAGSEREADQIRLIFGQDSEVRVVPMAPSVRAKSLQAGSQRPEHSARESDSTLRLVYFGRLSLEKNLPFAFDLLARFVEAQPERTVVYDLYHPDEIYPKLRQLTCSLPSSLQINFISGLSYEALQVRLHAEAYSALLMPSLSENFSYTVLEAMQAGISPLISDQTPWRDLQLKGIGWDLSLDNPNLWLAGLDCLVSEDTAERVNRRDRVLAYVENFVAEYPADAQMLFDSLGAYTAK